MLAAYNYLSDNINPLDKKLLKGYKSYTQDFKKMDLILIPSNSGQNFIFRRVKLFSKYNSKTSTNKLLT